MTSYQKFFADESAVPGLYAQDAKKGEEAVVYSIIYAPAMRGWFWCVTEKAPDSGLCFGYVNGDFGEFGYFDLEEMLESGLEFQIHPKWTPGMTMGQIREAFQEEIHDA